MSHQYLKRPPIYERYDCFSVYIERGDLKQYRSPLRCSIGLCPWLYVEQKNSHLDKMPCKYFFLVTKSFHTSKSNYPFLFFFRLFAGIEPDERALPIFFFKWFCLPFTDDYLYLWPLYIYIYIYIYIYSSDADIVKFTDSLTIRLHQPSHLVGTAKYMQWFAELVVYVKESIGERGVCVNP